MSLATTTHPAGRFARRLLFIGGEVRPVSPRLAKLLLILPAIGATLDATTFARMINALGPSAEQNPFAVWLMTNFGVAPMLMLKALSVLIAWRILLVIAKRQPALAIVTAIILHDLALFGAFTNLLSVPIVLPF